MEKQLSFFQLHMENRRKKKKTRRERFLETLEQVTPWKKLEAKVSRYYAKAGPQGGRPAYPLSVMLHIHIYQILNNLSDPAMEDALYDMYIIREYAGIGEEDRIPDETTILNFRHLLERHDLGKKLFRTINKQLMEKGLMIREGTIVDATFIEAASSTKNRDGKRDPEMSSGKKGNTWHFGMKMHAGVDAENGLVHSLEFTGANEHDITQASKLLHGEEESIHGDAGYTGLENRDEMQGRMISCYIAERPGKRRRHAKGSIADQIQELMARVRSKVEHLFQRIKIQLGYVKVMYWGIEKNANRLYLLSGFANLMRVRRRLVG